MPSKIVLIAAAASIAAAPCMAASLEAPDVGERKSGAAAGLYLSVPFSGERGGKPQAGLRLQMTHDYRDASARHAPVVRADALDLRMIGDQKPTLYVAGRPVSGEEARKRGFVGGTLVTVAVLALAAVGAIVIINAIDDDDDENCLDPNLCD